MMTGVVAEESSPRLSPSYHTFPGHVCVVIGDLYRILTTGEVFAGLRTQALTNGKNILTVIVIVLNSFQIAPNVVSIGLLRYRWIESFYVNAT